MGSDDKTPAHTGEEETLLYLHIPFCDSKCHYCAFNSYVDRFELKEAYMKAVAKQLLHDLDRFGLQKGQIATLFIGGGTPSTILPALYEPFFETLGPYLKKGAEVTAEANPNSASAEWLSGMRALGVNRISFGVQSFFDDKLKFLGRAHRGREAVEAIERAAATGFERLSLDLIYATALDTPRRVAREVETALSLPIDHLSAYELTLEEGTPFAQRPEVRRESLEQARLIAEKTAGRGWERYEVSNFGLHRCRHNLGYWEYKPYLGVGSGAVGRVGLQRYYPSADPESYVDDPYRKETETLDEKAVLEEKLLLGLRSCVGVEERLLPPPVAKRAELLVREKRLVRNGGRLYCPDFLLADETALYLLC